MLKNLAILLSAGVSATAIAGIAPTAAHAQAATYDIRPGSLRSALDAWARTSRRQVIYRVDEIRGARSRGASGALSAEAALEALLAGSGFASRADSSGAVAIVAAGNGQARSGEIEAGGAAADSGSASEEGRAEILVIGQRTLNADIRRTENDSQPYVVLGREEIEQSGARNLEDFLKQRATASASYLSPIQDSSNIFGGTSELDLRGLGADETLILVDGRRVAGFFNPTLGNSRQPDLNSIPLGAVERIEILPSSASGIFGGGATGGVVNIVLRRNFSGLDVRASIGNTYDLAMSEVRLDVTGGLSLEDGRTSILFSGSYADAGRLSVGERNFAQQARALAFNVNAAGAFNSATLGATANIRTTDGSNLVLRPEFGGAALPSRFTSVPFGYAGPESDNGAALASRAGTYNLEFADNAQSPGNRRDLLNVPTVLSLNATIRRRFAPWLELFVDGGLASNESESLISTASTNFTLAATSPANPFTRPIEVTVPARGVDGVQKVRLHSARAAAGAIVDLGGDWSVSPEVTWNRTRFDYRSPGAINPATVNARIADGTYNLFRDPALFPIDLSRDRLPDSYVTPVRSTLWNAALRLGGPLPFRLPGGAPSVTGLAEYRETRTAGYALFQVSPFFVANPTPFTLVGPQRQRVTSQYAEARFPIIGPDNGVPFAHLLELQVAARHDDYSTRNSSRIGAAADGPPPTPFTFITNQVSSVDPTVSGRWAPVRGLILRGSYATGFLPPDLQQLRPFSPSPVSALIIGLVGLRDPLRGNTPLQPFTNQSGGNPDLLPEQSVSWSAGGILEPAFIPGLRLSVDWTRITKRDAITNLNALNAAQLAQLLQFAPERVTRGANLPGDQAGWPGPVTAINSTLINIAEARIEALDFGFDYRRETRIGLFDLLARATHVISNRSQVVASAPVVENVDIPINGGGVDWRGTSTLSWSNGGWRASWTVNWFDGYKLPATGPFIANLGRSRISSQIYHNLYLSYRFGPDRGALANSEIQLGLNNVFDTRPPLDVGGYSPFGDPRLGSWYLAVRRSF